MNDEVKDILEKAFKQGRLDGFEFAIFMQNLLISKDGYVNDIGNWENVNANWENVNAEVAARLAERIKKHPILWKLFFMVA